VVVVLLLQAVQQGPGVLLAGQAWGWVGVRALLVL
jgi:hypothetical protein